MAIVFFRSERKEPGTIIPQLHKAEKPILFVLGTGRDQFPQNTLTIRNYSSITIDGGHHFDDDAGKVAAGAGMGEVKRRVNWQMLLAHPMGTYRPHHHALLRHAARAQ